MRLGMGQMPGQVCLPIVEAGLREQSLELLEEVRDGDVQRADGARVEVLKVFRPAERGTQRGQLAEGKLVIDAGGIAAGNAVERAFRQSRLDAHDDIGLLRRGGLGISQELK